MKNVKKLLSLILTVCMVLSLLPMTVQADVAPYTISIGTVYSTLSETLANASDGAIITLLENITESVTYTASADKTITIDGSGFTLTGTSTALTLTGTGLVKLKNLTLQGNESSGTSTGLDVSGSVSVQSYGTVTANGSAATATSSYGVTNSGTGTVDVTEAVAAGIQLGFGAYNTGSGTINVGSATGSGAMNGVGAYNKAGGTINVTTASANRTGVTNLSSGTINVTTVTNTDAADPLGSAINNVGTGTVNAGAANGGQTGVSNLSTGTVNAGTITGTTTNSGGGTVNTGAAVTVVPLHVGTGASCVLDSITIAKSGSTIGTLPDVYKGSECSAEWYTGIALANQFNMTEISGEATLYSSFYTIETAEDVAAYITEEVGGLTAGVNGSTVTIMGTATVTSANDAALTLEIPSGVTVVWKAALSGGGSKYLLEPTGDGTFEVADGADIVNTACQAAIYCWDGKGTLNVTGGKVSATVSGIAIGVAGDWLLTMTGGEVAANAVGSCAIFGRNPVAITGGTVSATDASGYQLYMGDTSIYRNGILDTGKIMYHTSGDFAEVCADTAVTQAQPGTSTGLTVVGHNLATGSSVTVVWEEQNGVSGVNISYYSKTDTTNAYKTEFLAVPGVTVTTTYTVIYNKNGGDTEASPTTKTVAPGESVGTLPSAPSRSGYTFSGWNTAADGSGAVFTASVIVKSDITVYAQWSKNSSSGTGTGGNSSGGGGGSTSTVTPPATQPTTPTVSTSTENSVPSVTSTTTTEAKSDSNGKATAAVTESQATDAVNKAVEAAAKQGTGTEAKVEIRVTAPIGAKTVELSLPKAAVTEVADSKIFALTVSTPVAAITFDKAAITTISKEAAADVKITASKVDSTSLTEETKAVVGDRPVFNFSVTSGDKMISQFGGNVLVAVPYTPKAGEDTSAIVIYYINAQGKPETVSDCSYDPATGTIKFTTNHFSQYAVGYNKVSFKDVAADAWYSKAVSFVAARGITAGTGDGNYNPDGKLTRGQFITMVMRAYRINPDENTKDNFADAGNTYYTGYLAAAKNRGITNGIGNNMFAPEKEITRQEMFTLLYNILKQLGKLPATATEKTLASCSDSNEIASWAKDAMTLFIGTGTISGSGGNLKPADTTNRAQIAQVLYNLLSK